MTRSGQAREGRTYISVFTTTPFKVLSEIALSDPTLYFFREKSVNSISDMVFKPLSLAK